MGGRGGMAGNGFGGGRGMGGGGGAGEVSLYVSNVAWEAGWQDLKDHFKQFGRVTYVDIARDQQTGKSLGRGVVRFEDAQSARIAVMHGNASNFMGREINVREDRMQGGLGGLGDGGSM